MSMQLLLSVRNIKIFGLASLESGMYEGAKELSVLSVSPADWRVYRGVFTGEINTSQAARTIAAWGDPVPEGEARGLILMAELGDQIKGLPYSD